MSITSDKMDGIIDFISSVLSSDRVTICFYGGEPLMEFASLQLFIEKIESRFNFVKFYLNTNGTLLNEKIVKFLYEKNVHIYVSLDGCKSLHDKKRRSINGTPTYDIVYQNILIIKSVYRDEFNEKLGVLVTVDSIDDILAISKEWDSDLVLKDISPAQIGVVATNYSKDAIYLDYDQVKAQFYTLLQLYSKNTNNRILKCFFEDYVASVKMRGISPLAAVNRASTCMPNNHKCFIDVEGRLGVCEKMCDNYRIGDIYRGFDFDVINNMIERMIRIKSSRCSICQFVRVCDVCLLSLDLSDAEMDLYCHNEQIHNKIALLMLCELAEMKSVLDL